MKNLLFISTLLLLIAFSWGTIFKRSTATNTSCVCKNGLNGHDGRDGRNGKNGKDGVLKVIGAKPGVTIKPGPRGPQGPGGVNGRPGTPGAEGPKGRTGDEGIRGRPGSGGPDGIGASMEEIGRLVEATIRKYRPSSGGDGTHGSDGTHGGDGGIGSKDKPYSVCEAFYGACGDCVCREKNFNEEFNGKDYYCDCQDILPERDCLQHRANERYTNGVYLINPGRTAPFPVFCDMVTSGGGWSVIQRRSGGHVDFKRDWFAYENGFGDFPDEYWLGLKHMYLIQIYDDLRGTELWLEAIDMNGKGYRMKYSVFEIGDESQKYKLHVDGYEGDGGDWLKDYNNQKFCTFDNDNDQSGSNLAYSYGPFWHGTTHYATHPNNAYVFHQVSTHSHNQPQMRVFNGKINGKATYLKSLEIKIRRKY